MTRYLVISAVGEDRPGIVKTLSESIVAVGANIDESRMTLLGGEFAGILLVSGDADVMEALQVALPEIERKTGLSITTKETTPRISEQQTMPYEVTAVAMDQPGIVHRVTEFFSERDINIRELSTSTYAAAHSGTPMFALEMIVDVATGSRVSQLRKDFVDFCDDLLIDAAIESVN
jgi:glycine cleavage system transcriptional repressor